MDLKIVLSKTWASRPILIRHVKDDQAIRLGSLFGEIKKQIIHEFILPRLEGIGNSLLNCHLVGSNPTGSAIFIKVLRDSSDGRAVPLCGTVGGSITPLAAKISYSKALN